MGGQGLSKSQSPPVGWYAGKDTKMSRTLIQIELDVACRALKAAMHNPYAVARYIAQPASTEQQWKDFVTKRKGAHVK